MKKGKSIRDRFAELTTRMDAVSNEPRLEEAPPDATTDCALTRFSVGNYALTDGSGQNAIYVLDAGTQVCRMGTAGCNDLEKNAMLESKAAAWLDNKWPDWRNPLAYREG